MHRRQTLDTWQCMYVTISGKMCTNKCNFAFQAELLNPWMQRPQTPFQGSGARLATDMIDYLAFAIMHICQIDDLPYLHFVGKDLYHPCSYPGIDHHSAIWVAVLMWESMFANAHHSSPLKQHVLKLMLKEDKDSHIAPSQYYGCWWPGDISHQGISSHGIDLVCLEYSSVSNKSVQHY